MRKKTIHDTVMAQTFDGFPFSYRETLEKVVDNRQIFEKIVTVAKSEVNYEKGGKKAQLIFSTDQWKLLVILWFANLPFGEKHIVFEGDLDAFMEDYLWVQLSS